MTILADAAEAATLGLRVDGGALWGDGCFWPFYPVDVPTQITIQFLSVSTDLEISRDYSLRCPGHSIQIAHFFLPLVSFFHPTLTSGFRTSTTSLLWTLWTWIYLWSLPWTLDIASPSLTSVSALCGHIPCQLILLTKSLLLKLSTFDV